MRSRHLIIAFLLTLTACGKGDKQGLSACSASIGACANAPGASCGVSFGCKSSSYELKCTPPSSVNQKEIECQCIENSVIGKTAKLTWPMQGEAAAVASSACGWPK
jgi:hypothetical protein